MAGQSKAFLRALRKKYRLGEFSKKKSSKTRTKRTKKTYIKKKRNYTMARRRTTKYRRSRRGLNFNPILGIALYGFAENTIDSLAQKVNLGIPTNVLQTMLGYYLMNKSGFVGSTAKAMFYVNGAQVMKSLMGGNLNLFGTGTSQNHNVSTSGW